MLTKLMFFPKDDSGATAIEYGLIAALVSGRQVHKNSRTRFTGLADRLKREHEALHRVDLERAFMATSHGGVYQSHAFLQ